MLLDDAQSPLPPFAAAPDRQILNMVAIDTVLEIENIGNIHQTISLTISLWNQHGTWRSLCPPIHRFRQQLESFDGSSSFEFVLQGGSSKIILVSVTAPPSASMGERALLSFRTTEEINYQLSTALGSCSRQLQGWASHLLIMCGLFLVN